MPRTTQKGNPILISSRVKDMRTILSALLNQEGYATIHSHSPEETLEVLASKPVDLVILDLVGPFDTGDEFMQGVDKEVIERLYVIMLTNVVQKNVERKEGCETVFYVSKPFVNKVIRSLVRFLLKDLDNGENQQTPLKLRMQDACQFK